MNNQNNEVTMKNSSFLVIILLFHLSCSCSSSSDQIELKQDPGVLKVYNKNEILTLSKLVSAFDNIIVENSKRQVVALAYNEYFESLDTAESIEGLHNKLINSEEIDEMIQELKEKDIFNEIWKYSYNPNFQIDNTTTDLVLNLQGKHFELLKYLAENNNIYKGYTKSLQRAGGINPALTASVIKDYYKAVDFNKEVNRLVWAIHYITITFN